MDNDKIRDISGILRILDHNIDNAEPILNDLEKHPMFSHPARKYKAVNLRINMHRIQIEIRDFLKEVKQYEGNGNNSDVSADGADHIH